ncbi:MAG: DUF559 domain-containing protein [Patescibacteria group bacterium]
MESAIHNVRRLKDVRRALRRNMPKSEVVLWSYLRNRQLGVKFRRQHSIGPYIVDFYCPGKRLIIEVDGENHANSEQRAEDLARDVFAQQCHIRVVRVLNTDIQENIRGVIDEILHYIR